MPRDVNDIKHAWVERIGAECTRSDIPFFLEFVGYEEGGDEKGIEFARKEARYRHEEHGGILQAAIRRGRAESEVPVNMAFVEGSKRLQGPNPPTRAKKPSSISAGAAVAKKPFIYLVRRREQRRTSPNRSNWRREADTNFSGVLCGRATWKDGIPVYAKQGAKALEDWLSDQGVKNINNVNGRLKAAKPWFSFYGASSAAALAD